MKNKSTNDRPVQPDWIERLVRLADDAEPEAMPGKEQIRSSLRPIWLAEVARLRRRRLLRAGMIALPAAAVLLIVVSALFRSSTPADAPPIGTLAAIGGEVAMSYEGSDAVPTTGDAIPQGATITTADHGFVSLTTRHGHSIRIDGASSVTLAGSDAARLARGRLYVDSGDDASSPFAVETRLGTARDVGTQFDVRDDGSSVTIRVREGIVVVAGSSKLRLTEGHGATIRNDRSTTRFAITPDDPSWLWAARIAPPFDVAGRPLSAFLAWMARENGLRVEYLSHEAEIAANEALQGTARLDASADSARIAAATAGLDVTIEGPLLRIDVVLPRDGPSHR